MANEIAQTAENVLRTLGLWRLPVDPLAIIEEERIFLAPGSYGAKFDARIEFFRSSQRFAIYYQDAGRSLGRIRFSLAHELGHYFLPEHQERLFKGILHNSKADYRSRDPFERQADEFAAHLLMPEALFIDRVRNFRQGVCTLGDLLKLADRLQTSVLSTAVRYCTCCIEPVTAILCEDGMVQWTFCSEDMRSTGCWFVAPGTSVPDGTPTARLQSEPSHNDVVEGRVDSSRWFDWPKRPWVYEEAIRLGNRTLTWLVIDG